MRICLKRGCHFGSPQTRRSVLLHPAVSSSRAQIAAPESMKPNKSSNFLRKVSFSEFSGAKEPSWYVEMWSKAERSLGGDVCRRLRQPGVKGNLLLRRCYPRLNKELIKQICDLQILRVVGKEQRYQFMLATHQLRREKSRAHLRHRTKRRKHSFKYGFLPPHVFRYIFSFAASCSVFESFASIDVSGNELKGDSVNPLLLTLAQLTGSQLSDFRMHSSCTDMASVHSGLRAFLQCHRGPSLKLVLSDNLVGVETLYLLRNELRFHRCRKNRKSVIRELHLACCNLDCDDIEVLTSGVLGKDNLGLRVLNLSSNSICDAGANNLSTRLKADKVLSTLLLYNNHITKSGVKGFEHLLCELQHASPLKCLGLAGNPVRAHGAERLVHNPSNCEVVVSW